LILTDYIVGEELLKLTTMDIRQSQGGESLLQLEIQKVQQSFAMSANDEPEEFEDIQFFHRLPPQLQTFRTSSGGGGADLLRTNFSANDMESNSVRQNEYMLNLS